MYYNFFLFIQIIYIYIELSVFQMYVENTPTQIISLN